MVSFVSGIDNLLLSPIQSFFRSLNLFCPQILFDSYKQLNQCASMLAIGTSYHSEKRLNIFDKQNDIGNINFQSQSSLLSPLNSSSHISSDIEFEKFVDEALVCVGEQMIDDISFEVFGEGEVSNEILSLSISQTPLSPSSSKNSPAKRGRKSLVFNLQEEIVAGLQSTLDSKMGVSLKQKWPRRACCSPKLQ